MGQAKNRRRRLLESQQTCIFCGQSPSTEEDHYPPRAVFPERRWPEGFSFGACERCNKGSADYDLIVAVLSKFDPTRQPTEADLKQGSGHVARLFRRFPDATNQLFGMPPYTREPVSTALGIEPIRDAQGRELLAVGIPPIVHEAVHAFMAKVSKALHFTHTGRIVPTTAGMRGHWFSNADRAKQQGPLIPDSVVEILGVAGPIQRARQDLREYFDYRYATSGDGAIGAYLCGFGASFAFICFVTIDPDVIEGILAQISARPEFAGRGEFWKRVAWPPPTA
jgi:hypothetical protein